MSPWTLPIDAAQQPDLAVTPDGSLLMSWIEQTGDMQRLWFSRWRDGRWSAPQSIAQGEGIGNGADTPHLRQTPDGALWATWLRKRGSGHARDIVIARSANGGLTWSAPAPVNTDGTATEHGFASLWADGPASLGVAWLDGRETGGEHAHDMHAMHGSGGHGGMHDAGPEHATMLRTAVFDAQLARHDESVIDTATCDCCQTDVAVLADGPRLVYRDRAPGEIRDIALLTHAGKRWSSPTLVHVDNWRMPACPVNGPAIAGDARDVSVAWYTMRGDTPTVRFARSADGGATFGDSIDLASAADVQGRVDVALDATGAWVAWLTEASEAQALHLAHVPTAAAAPDRTMIAATLAGRGRATGWPRLVVSDGTLHAVWTDVHDGHPVLHGATMPVQ
ncbi:sialidase family protein [Lysobacter sp. TY2-98]|uniref:sialidase family protein n=1 Tax=Lysobacter sp. TY2-98 TaxID=2290922 RepID=UPI0013B3DB18|nr:sialidase family protein [Lysobacter sp. TY2-98]